MNIELIPLLPEDKDITDLMRIHASPSVAKYIHISENFFDYATSTDKVIYYKILWNRALAGGVHCEYADGTMFLGICIDEIYRRHGIAEAALNQLFLAQSNDVNVIEVGIDETNVPSLSLFQKLGFSQIGREEELIILRKLLCFREILEILLKGSIGAFGSKTGYILGKSKMSFIDYIGS